MGLIYSVTIAVLLWIVLWALAPSIGLRHFDAIIFAAGIMVAATAVWRVLGYVTRRPAESAGDDADRPRF